MSTSVGRAATRFLEAGRFAEAEDLLVAALREDPGDRHAALGLATAAMGQGRSERGYDILARLATRDPEDAEVQRELGATHLLIGRPAEARICLERAQALDPDDREALLLLGRLCLMEADLGGARKAARALLAGPARSASRERRAEPEPARFRAAILFFHGLVDLAEGDLGAAETAFRAAANAHPEDAGTLKALSYCRLVRGDLDEAATLAEAARLASPLDLGILEHLARCLAARGRAAEAEGVCRKILASAPHRVATQILLARILVGSGRVEEGLAGLGRFVRGQPHSTEALVGLATVLRRAGRDEEALAVARHAETLAPEDAEIRDLRVACDLALGRFPPASDRPAAAPEAAPEPGFVIPPGMTGPEIVFFARHLRQLVESGGPVRVAADPVWSPLLRACGAEPAETAPDGPEAVARRPLAALARRFGFDPARLPPVPYLAAPEADRARWRRALDACPGRKIGFVWAPAALRPSPADFRAASPAGISALGLAEAGDRVAIAQWPEALDAGRQMRRGLADLLALVAELDLVVGVDSLPLLLAGAMGRPAIALVPMGAPWYLAAPAGRSPWFPSLRVIGQVRPESWDEPLALLREALASPET